MAHALLPEISCNTVNSSNMCPTDFTTRTTLSEILQSDQVKRLFNQPNIIIKTVPVETQPTSSSDSNVATNQTNDSDLESRTSEQTELSVIPLRTDLDKNKEEENLLPSKRGGKSEITLVPIKREKKSCGHYEPCENIVCDVLVQQYVDRDGSSPLIAVNIEKDEINAPVSKHCANERCDALSIDHNRCRRAVIRLNRCNLSTACDICGVALPTQRCRMYHRNCTRKNEYRHNEVDGAEILKERIRERDIQMVEASNTKKNNYMDPVTGYNLAIETLRNNEELIIIPKSVPAQQRSVTQPSPRANNINHLFGNLLPNIPIVLPQQGIVLGKTQCSNENNLTVQVTFTEALSTSILTATTALPLPQNQYVTFATQSNAQPITINDFLLSQSQILSSTPIRPKPLLTPIRVVPITNLITQPSLLHQTQGIPKFCIMADDRVSSSSSSSSSAAVTNPQPIQPTPTYAPKVEIPKQLKPTLQKKKKVVVKKERKPKKKTFKCDYCLKRLSTEWYFKIHVAKHESAKLFPCKLCTQTFSNGNDLKNHMSSDHESISNSSSTPDEPSVEQNGRCTDCNIIYTSVDHLKRHRQKCHGITECTVCQSEVLVEELDNHVAVEHENEGSEKVSEENGENSNSPNDNVNSVSIKQEVKENDDKKTNGYISVSDQNVIKDIKKELIHEA